MSDTALNAWHVLIRFIFITAVSKYQDDTICKWEHEAKRRQGNCPRTRSQKLVLSGCQQGSLAPTSEPFTACRTVPCGLASSYIQRTHENENSQKWGNECQGLQVWITKMLLKHRWFDSFPRGFRQRPCHRVRTPSAANAGPSSWKSLSHLLPYWPGKLSPILSRQVWLNLFLLPGAELISTLLSECHMVPIPVLITLGDVSSLSIQLGGEFLEAGLHVFPLTASSLQCLVKNKEIK